jgi:hypothetical protein
MCHSIKYKRNPDEIPTEKVLRRCVYASSGLILPHGHSYWCSIDNDNRDSTFLSGIVRAPRFPRVNLLSFLQYLRPQLLLQCQRVRPLHPSPRQQLRPIRQALLPRQSKLLISSSLLSALHYPNKSKTHFTTRLINSHPSSVDP